mmetsp:Transcript_27133/g.71383  ORF Transcript_27133/g.71383 Transcript_27133/m.71383 type:complete len:114 (-) Transcript_27133:501-842(-)
MPISATLPSRPVPTNNSGLSRNMVLFRNQEIQNKHAKTSLWPGYHPKLLMASHIWYQFEPYLREPNIYADAAKFLPSPATRHHLGTPGRSPAILRDGLAAFSDRCSTRTMWLA